MNQPGIVGITGAYGYLGSRIREHLESVGWRAVALVRTPRADDHLACRWILGEAVPEQAGSLDALVHCAYDMTQRTWNDIARVNVSGSRVLLRSAAAQAVGRILVLSSMSAYPGTKQLYGRAKLEIEALTLDAGGIAVRPGLVYGPGARGMVGTLAKLVELPVAPVIGGSARQYPILESDFTRKIGEVLGADTWRPEVFGIAQPTPVTFRDVVSHLARERGNRCRLVPVPWQLIHLAVKIVERVRPSVGIRSDSLLGLVHPAPSVPKSTAFPHLLEDLAVMS